MGSGKISKALATRFLPERHLHVRPVGRTTRTWPQYRFFAEQRARPGRDRGVLRQQHGGRLLPLRHRRWRPEGATARRLQHDKLATNPNLAELRQQRGRAQLVIDGLAVHGRNRAGIVPNSLNNDDAPTPQNGACPGGTTSCFFIEHNVIGKNNNSERADLRASPQAIGTGVEISGGAYDTVRDNLIIHPTAEGRGLPRSSRTKPPPLGVTLPGRHPRFPRSCATSWRTRPLFMANFFCRRWVLSATSPTADLATVGCCPTSAKKPRNCFLRQP